MPGGFGFSHASGRNLGHFPAGAGRRPVDRLMANSAKTAISPMSCPPLCGDCRLRTGAERLEGQSCHGVERRVALSLHERVNRVGAEAMAEWTESEEDDYLTVYSTKEFSAGPAVFIGRGGWVGVKLTSSEARLLAEELFIASIIVDEVHQAMSEPPAT